MFDRLAVIGVGLIGGSVARAAREAGQVRIVVGFDQNAESVQEAINLGVVDEAATDISAAVQNADLILLAVPMKAMESVLRAIHESACLPDVIIMDVGSVKSAVITAAVNVFGSFPDNFIPGHPIAGSERHGVSASRADLFTDHKVILTPPDDNNSPALRRIAALWSACGAEVITMSPERHDAILAQTSHLPHLLAYALVDTLSSQGDSLEIFQYAAGGFRDFSRIAASDPIMWRDIFATNREPVLAILDRFMADLNALRVLVDENRMDELAEVFARAKHARDHFTTLSEKSPRNNEEKD